MTAPEPAADPRPPDLEGLTAGLRALVQSRGCDGALAVVDRAPNPYWSTASSEIVTCRRGDGRIVALLCKYGRPGDVGDDYGHRRGIAHEADVYRRVLLPLGVTVPRFLGTCRAPDGGRPWLVVEYLHGAIRVNQSPGAGAMVSAAAWLGRFHAAAERAGLGDAARLPTYDAGYYRGWAQRTLDFARHARCSPPWLGRVCERIERFAAPLLEASPTVIHGEFYPDNVLSHDGRIVAVDWETAALAAGEIDVASLTEGWPAALSHRCQAAYRRSRWPSGPPSYDFERRLAAARVYWSLRWLGQRPQWLLEERFQSRFGTLRALAKDAGLI